MTDPVTVAREDGVATVALNRPDRLNALNKPMWLALAAAFRALSGDDSVRCVVLRGAGKAFSPGADVGEFAAERADPDQAHAYGRIMDDTYAAMRECPHPMIARIAGSCTGAGMILALLCDLRIAGAGAKFGAPVSRLGLAMPLSEFSILLGAVGRARALEILLEARVFDAHEAQAKQIVQRVVVDDELDAAVADSVRRITDGAPLVNRWHKAFARRLSTPVVLNEQDVYDSYASFATEDYREGFQAFLAKRKPVFRGR